MSSGVATDYPGEYTRPAMLMHELVLRKADGRALTLYSRRVIHAAGADPPAFHPAPRSRPHFRWHPLLGEWVAYAAERQQRTFLPAPAMIR